MVRTRDEVAATARRGVFVDAALQLIADRGYDAMSIQDVLRVTGSSKGAFYHYFGSKEDLLDAVVETTADEVTAGISSEVGQDSTDRLRHLYRSAAASKSERASLIRQLAAVWYSDDNSRMRERARAAIRARVAPVLEQIVGEGVRRGDFRATDPVHTAQILVDLILDLNDRAGRGETDLVRRIEAHEEAVSRILAIDHTVRLIDRPDIDTWVDREAGER